MNIVGAGLSGLIAGHAFPNAVIYEKGEPRADHRALLRFRSDAVSRVTNIPFKKVTVRKGIFDTFKGKFVAPTIAYANQYSAKVLGHLYDRSIWNLEPATRYIAPEDFYHKLTSALSDRIKWNQQIDPIAFAQSEGPIISTIPLSAYGDRLQTSEVFKRAPITVYRYRVKNSDVYQTIYFPDINTAIYRASITGDLLIVELVAAALNPTDYIPTLAKAFGIPISSIEHVDVGRQEYGKIAPIDERERRRLIVDLTRDYNIYSLGRFATWRNILLDDVVNDIDVIKSLIHFDQYSTQFFRKV